MSPTEMSRETRLIFIYGTLKQGYPNNHYMPVSTKYAGAACTTNPWPLVIDTEMSIPFLLRIPDHPNAKIVQGELYYTDEPALQFLDNFEGLQTGFYIREQLTVVHPCPVPDFGPEPVSSTSAVNPPSKVLIVDAYFRSPANEGPAWARKWTVERLLALPMVSRYSQEHAQGFVAKTEREEY